MSSRHARTLLPTKKRRQETLLPGGSAAGGGRGEKEETFWMKEFIYGRRISSVSFKRRRRDYLFS
jgi:hypothetical protein